MSASEPSNKRFCGSPSDDPPQKKTRRPMDDGPSLNSKPITIVAGEEKQEFYVHENVLKSSSEFFKNALNKDWNEHEERTVVLPEAEPEAVGVYVKWLYTGNLYLVKDGDRFEVEDKVLGKVNAFTHEGQRHKDAYMFADFIQDMDFKDAIIDCVMENMIVEKRILVNIANWIYPYSAKGSAHRQFAVDVAVYLWRREKWGLNSQNTPPDFLVDVLSHVGLKLGEGVEVQTTREFFGATDACKYHEHTQHNTQCHKARRGFLS